MREEKKEGSNKPNSLSRNFSRLSSLPERTGKHFHDRNILLSSDLAST